jgi:hypothetical protein
MNTSASLLFTIGIAFYCEMHHRMLDAKIKQDLNKNQGEKQKLNAVLEKEITR